jgi:hypothetical protein
MITLEIKKGLIRMKRKIAAFLALILLSSLFACERQTETFAGDDTPVVPSVETAPEENGRTETNAHTDEPPEIIPEPEPEIIPEPEPIPLTFYPAADPNERANAGRIAATDGEWIFYSIDYDGIYKMRIDGTEVIKITDDMGTSINVVGDWLYYIVRAGIYRMKKDGSERAMVIQGDFYNLVVIGDWIYYISRSGWDVRSFNKIRTDGTGKTQIVEEQVTSAYFYEDWIYFTTRDYENNIYKMRIDGTERTQLTESELWEVRIVGIIDGWIYHRFYANSSIFRVRIDGTDEELVTVPNRNTDISLIAELYITGDWFYFLAHDQCMSSRDGKLYRMRHDGSDRRMLVNDKFISYSINIIGDLIFYSNSGYTHKSGIYRQCPDGSDWQPLEITEQ